MIIDIYNCIEYTSAIKASKHTAVKSEKEVVGFIHPTTTRNNDGHQEERPRY